MRAPARRPPDDGAPRGAPESPSHDLRLRGWRRMCDRRSVDGCPDRVRGEGAPGCPARREPDPPRRGESGADRLSERHRGIGRAHARIESEVRAPLVAQHDATLPRLGVVSREQTVYLSGTVESGEQKETAESVARGVPGVKRVVSTLEVRSQKQEHKLLSRSTPAQEL